MSDRNKDMSGKGLERLVAALEAALIGSGALIESPSRRLRDRDTQRVREFDVLITWNRGHYREIMGIECRDRSRPIGVSDVEAFVTKCDRTGVNTRIMVSSKGFAETARVKAASFNITCMDIEDVERYDWIGIPAIVGYRRFFPKIAVRVMFADSGPTEIKDILDPDGYAVSHDEVSELVMKHVPAAINPDDEVGAELPVHMRMNTPGWYAQDPSGSLWPIDHMLIDTSFTTTRVDEPITSHRYAGGGKDYAFATANMPFADTPGKVVFHRRDDGSTDVLWVPQKK